jgi:hypothetical protein
MTLLDDPRSDPDAAYERHQDMLIDMAEEQRAEGQIEDFLQQQADERAGIVRIPDDPYWEEAHEHEWEAPF